MSLNIFLIIVMLIEYWAFGVAIFLQNRQRDRSIADRLPTTWCGDFSAGLAV